MQQLRNDFAVFITLVKEVNTTIDTLLKMSCFSGNPVKERVKSKTTKMCSSTLVSKQHFKDVDRTMDFQGEKVGFLCETGRFIDSWVKYRCC